MKSEASASVACKSLERNNTVAFLEYRHVDLVIAMKVQEVWKLRLDGGHIALA